MKDTRFVVASNDCVRLYLSDLVALENASGLPKTWGPDHFLHDLPLKWNLSRLLFFKDVLVGFAIISKKIITSEQHIDKVCHIHRFIIHQSYRGRGLGRQFMTHIKAVVFKDFDNLTLFVGLDNVVGLQFYRNSSFNPVHTIDGDTLMIAVKDREHH